MLPPAAITKLSETLKVLDDSIRDSEEVSEALTSSWTLAQYDSGEVLPYGTAKKLREIIEKLEKLTAVSEDFYQIIRLLPEAEELETLLHEIEGLLRKLIFE